MELKKVLQEIQKVGKVYVVGGFVRDLLRFLKDNPNGNFTQLKTKDVDFVVLGSGVEFAKKVDKVMGEVGSLVLFEDFDTARYVFDNGLELEFAGARSEEYKEDTRKPKVVSATLESDLSRRDFTVNAMALGVADLLVGKIENVVDNFNGIADLEGGILKTPIDPNKTFFDDPLRMMRAVRFSAQLDFEIEEGTYRAIEKNAERLKIISKERINEELFKLLKTKEPSVGLWALYNTKLFNYFLPEINDLYGVEEVYGQTHKNNLAHTFKVVDNISKYTDNVMLRFSALMHDIGKPGTKRFTKGRGWTFDGHEMLGRKMVWNIGRRLRMKKTDIAYTAKLVRWHQHPISLMDDKITDSAVRRLIVNAGEELEDLLKLGRSDITTGNPSKKERRLKNYDFLEERIEEVLERDKLRAFQSPVRGEEIMELCSLKPGPTVGKIKEAIETAILDGVIPNEHEPAQKYFLSIKDEYLKDVEDWEKT
ncbi:MAG: CCA tRNA nucleotidyltransferase [Candidatus Magasanikbacteria bacterium]|nr:CCA tRNA nucleotidyltransferase [Candidatus Magasanikbacteria bacterium]